jgi:hypothetical protein
MCECITDCYSVTVSMDCLLQLEAVRHYLLDVCVNPVHIDSWVGTALACDSQLETILNSVSIIFTVGAAECNHWLLRVFSPQSA